MFYLELICLFLTLYLGIKIKGSLGFLSFFCLFIFFFLFKVNFVNPPYELALLLLSIICLSSILDAAGSINYLVTIMQKLLNNSYKSIILLSPIITFTLVFLTGTSYSIFAILPIIFQTTQNAKIIPEKPLVLSVVAATLGCLCSPISSPNIAVVNVLEPIGIKMWKIIAVLFVSVFFAILFTSFIVYKTTKITKSNNISNNTDIPKSNISNTYTKKYAKMALYIYILGIVFIMAISLFDVFQYSQMNTTQVITISMLFLTCLISLFCKVPINNIFQQKTFSLGCESIMTIWGVSWLTNVFIHENQCIITQYSKDIISMYPSFYVVILLIVSALMSSHTATILTMFPIGLSLGISPELLLTCTIITNALLFLPSYPISIAAANTDTTGSIKMGKYVFDHSFMKPCLISMIIGTGISYLLINFVLR